MIAPLICSIVLGFSCVVGDEYPEIDTMPTGWQQPSDYGSDQSALTFLVTQMLLKLNTAALVRVVRVTNTGGLDPVGFVDVLPLVSQVTPEGAPIEHGVLHNVPYFRLQGGANAVVIDPEVGDVGLCTFCSRDISNAKAARGPALPGSLRYCDWADGLYVGGVLNGAPTQYVQFHAEGITIHSPTLVRVTAPTVEITATESAAVTAPVVSVDASDSVTITSPSIVLDGAVTQSGGAVAFGGAVTAPSVTTDGGIDLAGHTHPGVQAGGSNTGPAQ